MLTKLKQMLYIIFYMFNIFPRYTLEIPQKGNATENILISLQISLPYKISQCSMKNFF